MDASEHFLDLGQNLRWGDLASPVAERARLALLDTLASAVAGATAGGVAELAQLVGEWGGAPQATLLPNGRQLPAPLAALVNGVAARAWDLDDVHEQNTAHVSATTVPAVLAVAEARGGVSGRDLLLAIALGNEAICRITAAPRVTFSESGMAPGYQAAFFGGALAAARVLGLDRARMGHALGLAYARLAGNIQCYVDGTMAVRLMQGITAEAGVVAALMAERGLTGSRNVLEGKFGYFPVFQRGRYEPAELVDGLGERWRSLEISIKPVYPCCKYTHGPIEATAEAMRQAGVGYAEIERIDLDVSNREVYDLVCEVAERKWNPQSVAECQFSLPYTVAHAAVHGTVALESFTPAGMADAAVRALLPRIRAHLTADLDDHGRGTFPMPGVVRITLRSGRAIEARVVHVKGHPENAMTYADVADKMRACARFAGADEGAVERLIDLVAGIEAVADVRSLAMAAAAARPRD